MDVFELLTLNSLIIDECIVSCSLSCIRRCGGLNWVRSHRIPDPSAGILDPLAPGCDPASPSSMIRQFNHSLRELSARVRKCFVGQNASKSISAGGLASDEDKDGGLQNTELRFELEPQQHEQETRKNPRKTGRTLSEGI